MSSERDAESLAAMGDSARQKAWAAYCDSIVEKRRTEGWLAPSMPNWVDWHAGYAAGCAELDTARQELHESALMVEQQRVELAD